MKRLFNISVFSKGLEGLKTAKSLRVMPPVEHLNGFSFAVRCFHFQSSYLRLLRVEIFPPFSVTEDTC